MKKLFTILALSLVVSSTYAQKTKSTKVEKETSRMSDDESTSEYKPVKGTLTTEVGLTGGLNNASFDLNEGTVKFRYFLKDNFALRAGLGLSSTSNESSNVVVSPIPVTNTKVKTSQRIFTLGVEKHFSGSDRLSTYVGADLIFGANGASRKVETADGTFNNIEGATSAGGASRAGSFFGVRFTTGADYYIAKKVFLGVEAGIAYTSGSSDTVSNSLKATPAGATVNTDLFSEGKNSNTLTSVFGGVKIGYQF
jgi:hypothetical protein